MLRKKDATCSLGRERSIEAKKQLTPAEAKRNKSRKALWGGGGARSRLSVL